ncbi:PLD nuclease N-terminal domain-containing protein [Saccharopolyspora sp. MS10]|uniref:PLD nuclease N-terminal domain-containing protein n=1 Tax=Saccharopolyspora sp. MS10 TaxID=3385973 RepID=UPI00399FF46E
MPEIQLTALAQAADTTPHAFLTVLAIAVPVLIGLGLLALFIGALVSIFRSEADSTGKAVWTLIVLFAPVLGCVLWFLLGRSSTRGPAPAEQPVTTA